MANWSRLLGLQLLSEGDKPFRRFFYVLSEIGRYHALKMLSVKICAGILS
jgi:hypothetical protein